MAKIFNPRRLSVVMGIRALMREVAAVLGGIRRLLIPYCLLHISALTPWVRRSVVAVVAVAAAAVAVVAVATVAGRNTYICTTLSVVVCRISTLISRVLPLSLVAVAVVAVVPVAAVAVTGHDPGPV